MIIVDLYNTCLECLTSNGSGFYLLFVLIVAYFGYNFEKKSKIRKERHISPDRGEFFISTNSINIRYLTPYS